MELITGNKFKRICHYSYDEFGFVIHSEPTVNQILKVFVKIDYVHNFFSNPPLRPFILITHNGDLPVDGNYLRYMDNPNLIKWYGQNIMTVHPKLQSIPIGIANEKWPHGNESVFFEVMQKDIKKERLIYVNFDVNTNRFERNDCLSEINKKGLEIGVKLPFNQYLEEVAKSYFVVSPNGNGVDCHKTWESLYLKTIPIVTESININFYKNLPILIIKRWKDFNPNDLTIDKYQKIWGGFNVEAINVKKFLNNG
jgi:hypothetical protein